MTINFRDFARALDRASQKLLTEPVLRAKQDLARAALTRLVARTPVATGHARANWQVSLGSPAIGVVAAEDLSGVDTLANGVAAIMADREPFATVWLTNNAPYIQTLERGSSDQAPAGMVAVTVTELGRTK